jgi:death-on-curing protein
VVDTIHQDQITTHGGVPGVRDESALESALARPQQVFAYGSGVDIAALAAAYAYGLARNHPYHDGNKRIAFLATVVFAETNGYRFDATQTAVVQTMLRLAAGEIDEEALAEWVRANLVSSGG